ncbi:hypothetical protein ACFL3D_06680, partial [Candidatus Omnitrophota bacterium]
MNRVHVAVEKNTKNVAGHKVSGVRKFSYLILILAGAMLAISFSRLNTWYLPYISFIPFLCVLSRAQTYRQAFNYGFVFGCSLFIISIYWLFYVASFGV